MRQAASDSHVMGGLAYNILLLLVRGLSLSDSLSLSDFFH